MHFWEVCCIHGTDCFHASYVEQQYFFVCTYTDCEGAITCHLYTVYITSMALQISKVLSSLTIPNLDLLVNLPTT